MIAPLLFQDLDLLHPRLPCQLTLLWFQHDLVEDYRSNNYDDDDDDFKHDYDYEINTSSSSHVSPHMPHPKFASILWSALALSPSHMSFIVKSFSLYCHQITEEANY